MPVAAPEATKTQSSVLYFTKYLTYTFTLKKNIAQSFFNVPPVWLYESNVAGYSHKNTQNGCTFNIAIIINPALCLLSL